MMFGNEKHLNSATSTAFNLPDVRRQHDNWSFPGFQDLWFSFSPIDSALASGNLGLAGPQPYHGSSSPCKFSMMELIMDLHSTAQYH